jgi:hypothetical protein
MQRIEFALDATDVADLKDAAERAQTKTDTTRSTMSGGPVPLIIAGEPPTSYR